MPNYAWVCFACEHVNAAGTETCEHCGFGAQATGKDIEAARRSRAETELTGAPSARLESRKTPTPDEKEPSAFMSLLLIPFGLLCLFGAYQSFTGGHWPAFLPPQLDLIAVPLSWLSEKLGAYVGGGLAAMLGLFCVLGGLVSIRR